MTRTLVVIAILCSTACGDDRSWSQKELERGKTKIQRATEALEGATILSTLCCDPMRASPEASQACRALGPLIETSSEVHVLMEATKCTTKVPLEAVLGALQHRTLASEARAYVVDVLGEYAPTDQIVRTLVSSLDYPPTGNGGVRPDGDYEKVIDSIVTVLAYLGEDDLRPVVDALGDRSAYVRDNAARALWRAASVAPLDMPEALPILRGIAGTDADGSGPAGLALSAVEGRRTLSTAEEVQALAEVSEAQRIRLLSRRRRFCGSAEAVAELKRLGTASTSAEIRRTATEAIADQSKRCASVNHQ